MVSFIRTVSAPLQPMSSAVIGFAGLVAADHHAAQPIAHVRQIRRQREDRHDFAGHRDVESGGTREAFLLGPLADGDLAQHAIVGVEHAAPRDGVRIDIQARKAAALFRRQFVGIGFRYTELAQAAQHHGRKFAAAIFGGRAQALEQLFIGGAALVEHARVDGGREKIVGRGDGVNVAGEMEIEFLHRNDLAVAAAGRAAL